MWHVDAEIIALVFVIVLMFDIYKTNVVRMEKDRIFNFLSIATVVAILSDIISSVAMMQYSTTSWWFIQISLMAYFLLTPFLSMLWNLYAIAVTNKVLKFKKSTLLFNVIPYGIFALLVLSNPWTGWLFELSAANIYARGILFNAIFVLFYGYSLVTLILACVSIKKNERTTSVVLMIFPLIAGLAVFLQQILSGYLILGAAFTLVILITYMFLQNKKATRDSLTGINNRTSFLNIVERLSRRNEHGCILMIAIDDFKLFNQTFGQRKGDLLLCTMAEYFVSISPSKMAYRYGGDIFTIILKKSNTQEAMLLAKKIRDKFADSIYIDQVGYSISVCLGVVEYPHASYEKTDSIVTAMDFAIYQAKKRGKGQIAFFNDALVKQFKRKHDVAKALVKATENQLFEVYIQPVFDTKKQRFVSGEALLRLHDEKLGNISPAEFIPIAEENGQIIEISYFVLEKVCLFLKENKDVFKDEVAISVNFSVVQFMQADLVDKVKNIIHRYDIPPHLIKIEITESMIADNLEDVKTSMKRLSDWGISFALDDYGQGYSNICFLINLPFSILKLDKSIIDNITSDKTFVSALIPMFKNLNKRIIAEGVETKEQAELLKELFCDAIQGYYFARPMPMEKTLEFFCKR